jgi:O-antigen/teichoic acid export membrane protein
MSSSQPENYTRNVLSTYLNGVALAVVALLVTPLLTHHLGVTKFGVWALIGSLIPYFELLELGFANSTVNYVARHREAGEEDLIHRTLNTSFFVLMLPGLLAAGLAVVVAIFLPDIVHSIPHHLVGQARILLLLLAFDMAVSIPMDTFGGALIALQRYDILNASLVTVTVLQSVAWVIVLELHGGLVALGVVTVVIGLSGQVARFILLRRLVPRLSVSFRAFDRSILRAFVGLSGWFSLNEISGALIGGVDVIIVGIVVGVRGAAIFAVGARLASLPSQVMSPPASVVFPYAGQLAGRGDREGMRRINVFVTRQVMALAVPAALAVMILAVPAVRAWVGPSFHESAEIATILAASVIVSALGITPRAVVSGSGQPKVPTIVNVAEALMHIGLGIVLCRTFGAVGAAETALTVAVLLEGFVLVPTLYRKLEIPLLLQLTRLVRAHVIPVIVATTVGWSLSHWAVSSFVNHHGRVAGIAVVFGAGLAVILPYYLILSFTGMDRAERGRTAGWVRDRLKPGSSS